MVFKTFNKIIVEVLKIANIPLKNTRRWSDQKFIYTKDDGTNMITSQRISKNENGEPFLPINPLLLDRQINDKKTIFWGKPKNLRKFEITYEESRNQNNKGIITRYCPYNPLSKEIINFFKEIQSLCKNKFNPFNNSFCIDYRGENRFTSIKPPNLDA